MEIRVLPANHEAVGRAPEEVNFDPDFSTALIAEDEEGLAARVFITLVPVMEHPWIRPDLRNSTLAGRMHRRIVALVESFNLSALSAFPKSGYHRRLLKRLGYKKTQETVWEIDI